MIKIPSEIEFFLYLFFSYQLDLTEDFFLFSVALSLPLSTNLSPQCP